jgi:hypothetical protein
MQNVFMKPANGIPVVTATATEAPAKRSRASRGDFLVRRECGPAHDRLSRLRAVVLLKGTVRRSPFAEAIDRSVLGLPVDAEQTVLDLWRGHVAMLRDELRLDTLRCRIIVGRTTRLPDLEPRDHQAGMTVEMDPADLRGTGGVLRDLAEQYDDDDTLLVANAGQLLVEPLHLLARAAAGCGGAVTVAANGDGTPSSFALLSCRALRELPPVGFVDFKEQGLPTMSRRHEVTILRRATACGFPIRTPADYLAAVRAHRRVAGGEVAHPRPFEERWLRRFSLVERGATVAGDAILHDAIVLRGARIEPGAVVAESIVCSDAVIRPRENVVRQLIAPTSRAAIEEAG